MPDAVAGVAASASIEVGTDPALPSIANQRSAM